MQKYDVFLSHNSKDKPLVEIIANRLRLEAKLEPFLDKWHLIPGNPWQEELEEALNNSKAVAVFVGAHDISPWHNEEMRVALNRRASEANLRVIPVLLPGATMPERGALPEFLSRLTWVDFRGGINDDDAFHRLVSGIKSEAPGPGENQLIIPKESPYRGLEKFRPEDAMWFFGRDSETQHLIEKVKNTDFLAVLGASGSGKSSVVLAGLIPAVQNGAIEGSKNWIVITFTPKKRPLEELAIHLAVYLSENGPTMLLREMSEDERALHLNLRYALKDNHEVQKILLVVDQFEEVFTLCQDEDQRKQFFANLLYASSVAEGRLKVVLTMRADFVVKCAPYGQLIDRISDEQFFITPMVREQMYTAIVEPARRSGMQFESGLVEIILRDIDDEPGGLPLLEYALFQLWEKRKGNQLDFVTYKEIGGVTGALAKTADQLYEELPEIQQKLVQQIMLAMVQLGEGTDDTRRSVSYSELQTYGQKDSIERILQQLADKRLVTTERDEKEHRSRANVSHEALIRSWPRLRKWIDENREGLKLQRKLQESALDWEENKRSRSFLLRGPRLVEAITWLKNNQATPSVSDFIRRSKRQATLSRFAWISGLTILFTALIIVSIVFKNQSQENAWIAETAQFSSELAATQASIANARQLAAIADKNLDSDLRLNLLLANEALNINQDPQIVDVLLRGLQTHPNLLELVKISDMALKAVAIMPNNDIVATAGQDGIIRMWDISERKIIYTLDGHTDGVNDLDFSPDGNLLASCGNDNLVIVWDISNKVRLYTLTDHTDRVLSVDFNPSGKIIASAGADKSVILWDVETGNRIGARLEGHNDWVYSVAFSPDKKTLASISCKYILAKETCKENEVIIWDVDSGAINGEHLIGGPGLLYTLAFNKTGNLLATVGEFGVITLWNVNTREVIKSIGQQTVSINTVKFGQDDSYLILAGFDQNIYFLDITTGKKIGEVYTDHSAPINAIAISSDNTFIASVSSDGELHINNMKFGFNIEDPLKGHTEAVSSIDFSQDGKLLASGSYDNSIRLWDVESGEQIGQPLMGHTGPVYSVAFSPDGKLLASGSSDHTLRIWDLGTRRLFDDPLIAYTPEAGSYVTFNPAGTVLASSGYDDNSIRLWDVQSGEQIGQPLTGHTAPVSSIDFSPDGKLLVSRGGYNDYTIRLWDVESGEQIGRPLTGHTDYVNSVAFSPDGKLLASGSYDNSIRLWDVESGEQIGQPLMGHTNRLNSVAFSPNGETLASGSSDNTIRLWDVESGEQIGQPLIGYTFSFNPDGKLLASGSSDYTIRLWDVESGEQIGQPLMGHTYSVYSVAFSPDGTLLVSRGGYNDYTIRLWDVKTGEQIGQPFMRHSGSVNSVAFSPDGNSIASIGADKTILIWDVKSGWIIRAMEQVFTPESPRFVTFNPAGTVLASSGYDDNSIRLWDVESGEQIGQPLMGHTYSVNSVAFSPDGEMLASGSSDYTIRLWDVESGEQIGQPLTGHTYYVNSVAFSPDGEMLASGGNDYSIRLWDVESGEQIGQPLTGHTGGVNSIAFSPDGKLLASGSIDNTIRLWDVESGEQIGQPQRLAGYAYPYSVDFSPLGNLLASGGSDATVRFWNLRKEKVARDISINSCINEIAFSPDGKLLASGSYDKSVRLWDVESGEQIGQPLMGHTYSVNSVAFSPDGKLLASGSSDYTIQLWDVENGEQIGQPLIGHTNSVNSVAFSPNGEMLASGSIDNTIRLWDVESGIQIGQPLTGHTYYVNSVAFSPDGKLLASGSSDKSVRLWDVKSGEQIGQPLTGHTGPVYSVAFSPDGEMLASGDGYNDYTIRLWDVESGEQIGQPLTGHTDSVNSVAFSSDGKLLTSGSSDTTIRLWDVKTGEQIGLPISGSYAWPLSLAYDNGVFSGHILSVNGLAFSPQGVSYSFRNIHQPVNLLLASGGCDGQILFWNLDYAILKKKACQIINQNLNIQEWNKYFPGYGYRETCPSQ